MPIVVIGLSHHSSPVEVRERFAVDADRVPAVIQKLRAPGTIEEAVLLSTCNRVELYAATSDDADKSCADLKRFLHDAHNCEEEFTEHFYHHVEPDSLRHLFRVASGMESMVLGETEILGQLKIAYETARQHQHTAAELNKAFQSAFHVAKRIRTETDIQRGNISVASVAVQLADRIFESLRGQRVLIIGAGDTSEKTLRALVSRGVEDVRIANRTVATAEALAAEHNGRVVPFEQWADQLEHVDIVVSSTAAPGHILDAARLTTAMKQRRNSPLLLIDLAVPRDIDPEANQMNDVYLYNVDDLRSIADDHLLHRKAELDRCETIIREQVAEVLEGKRRRANALSGKRQAMGT